jgi:hypothetical protein
VEASAGVLALWSKQTKWRVVKTTTAHLMVPEKAKGQMRLRKQLVKLESAVLTAESYEQTIT